MDKKMMEKIQSRKESDKLLLHRLEDYGNSDYYPFHMPGHKRKVEMGITSFPNPFSVDITEIEGFDNLHHAEDILKDSMYRAASLYGSDRTYYLVNGSTGGILSAICGLTTVGGKIIMARNSHKAAYHAALLNRLEPVYIYPDFVEEFGIQGGIDPGKIEEALYTENREGSGGEDKRVQAVFITSPTYEGIVSDIEAIAEIAHRGGVPLIVDEAHGAHFPFGQDFPKSALECGADVVIQSLHKTLPSLTQTAVMHIKDGWAKPQQVERYLSVFQSSSPSYVFLASAENCIDYMGRQGKERMERLGVMLGRFREEMKDLKYLRLADEIRCGDFHIKDRDISKILVSTRRSGLAGTEAAELLRSRFHLEPEMSCGKYVLFMTTLMDTENGLRRLGQALRYLDETAGGTEQNEVGRAEVLTWLAGPLKEMEISEAWGRRQRLVPVREAGGAVGGSFITVYPPGVPMIVPGEVITSEAIELIERNRRLNLTVEGLTQDGRISVLE